VRNRLSLILAALALLVPAFALTGVAAQAATPVSQAVAKACPTGYDQQDYYCTPTATPSPSRTVPTTTPPSTTTPPLPVTGADAGVAAAVGGGVLLLGAIVAVWATMFRRRHRFEA